MTIRPCYLAAVTLAAVLGAGCDVHVGENGVSLDVASGKATDEWSRDYAVSSGGTVEVININGGIVVEAGSGSRVEVKATRTARASSEEEAQALLKRTEIKEAVTPGAVSIQTSTGGSLLGHRSVNVEYHLRVPAGLHISVKTENGGISLHDVVGTMAATTTNGGIRGSNLTGAVSAHIINGGIVMDVARVDGAIELDAVNGGIRLDVPADAKADIEAHAVNGGVSTQNGMMLTASEQSRTRISGKLNGGGTRIAASTVNGGVRIRTRSGDTTTESKEGLDEAGPVLAERKR